MVPDAGAATARPELVRLAYDEPLPLLSSMLAALAEIDGIVADGALAMSVAEVSLDLPFELEIGDADDGLSVGAAPPTQRIETSILPVFHRMTLRLVRNEA